MSKQQNITNQPIVNTSVVTQSSTPFITAIGSGALISVTGIGNNAHGYQAGNLISAGNNCTAIGHQALSHLTTGAQVTAIGSQAGSSYTGAESNNTLIGYNVTGTAGESNKVRIGNSSVTGVFINGINGATPAGSTVLPVVIDTNGQLGTSAGFRTNVVAFAASGTYTPSVDLVYAILEGVGGGAGGGGASSGGGDSSAGGGGGAGAYTRVVASAATIGGSGITVTIGAGGAGGAAAAGTGTAGGATSIGSLLTANGGSGGVGVASSTGYSVGAGGAGGTTSTGSPGIAGAPGGVGVGMFFTAGALGTNTVAAWGGSGGSSFYGAGGTPGSGSVGGAGQLYGSGGGGGAQAGSGTSRAGGAGSNGYAVVIEFLV